MVVEKAIFVLFFVLQVNILLGNPFPQNYEYDENGEIKYDDLDNPILLEEVNNFEGDRLLPGECILPAELQYDGNLPPCGPSMKKPARNLRTPAAAVYGGFKYDQFLKKYRSSNKNSYGNLFPAGFSIFLH